LVYHAKTNTKKTGVDVLSELQSKEIIGHKEGTIHNDKKINLTKK
jgi:hypothetical protein